MAQVKKKNEIVKIKRACKITDDIFNIVIKNFRKYKTEIALRDYILLLIKKYKVKASFPPIVSSGPRAGNEIHPKSTQASMHGFVIIDFGVTYKGYKSDMTRTVYVGKPKKNEIIKYKKVLQAQKLGIKKIIPNQKTALADKSVREYLGSLSRYFVHTLGHGVGKNIHEPPRIYEKRTRSYFYPNMVVTIEPGIYIKETLGIRIEDTCLVTEKGREVLTKSSKKLIVFAN